eukprot:2021756-Prymnesium_polylepis.1
MDESLSEIENPADRRARSWSRRAVSLAAPSGMRSWSSSPVWNPPTPETRPPWSELAPRTMIGG